jgi:hypothetical protein
MYSRFNQNASAQGFGFLTWGMSLNTIIKLIAFLFLGNFALADTPPIIYHFSTPLNLSVTTVTIPQANGSTDGYLSHIDWTTFSSMVGLPSQSGHGGQWLTTNGSTASWSVLPTDTPLWGTITGTLSDQTDLQSALNAKQNSLSLGNLTDSGTDGITVTGGTGAVVGSGTSLSQHVADTTHSGYLNSTDWNSFNNKGSGTVSSVSGTAPIVSTGGSTPAISIPQATSSVDGYLLHTDWATFNSKEPSISPGTTSQYWRGDKTFQTLDTSVVPENGNLYFTNARSQSAISASSPLTYSLGVVGCPTASGSQSGCLSSSDWTTFNNKAPIDNPMFTTQITTPYLNDTGGAFIAGPVAIGTGTLNAILDVESIFSSTSGTSFIFKTSPYIIPTGNSSGKYVAMLSNPIAQSANSIYQIKATSAQANNGGTGPITYVTGVDADAYNQNSGTISNAYGAYHEVINYSTGTITNGYGVYVSGGGNAGGGVFSNYYELYLATPASGITNAYSLYNSGGTAYFGGSVGIKNNAPAYPLDVTGTINASALNIPGGDVQTQLNSKLGALPTTAFTTNYTATGSGYYFANSASAISLTLPSAATDGITVHIKNVNTGILTINPVSAQTIDGQTSWGLNSQYQAITLVSQGGSWWVF